MRIRPTTALAAASAVIVVSLAPGTASAAGDAGPFDTGTVIDARGDAEVPTWSKTTTPLDITRVHSKRAADGALKVVVRARRIAAAERTGSHERFTAAIYVGGTDHRYTVSHGRDGHLTVLNLNTGRTSHYRNLTMRVEASNDRAVLRIPAALIGSPRTVAVSGGAFLLHKRTGDVWSADFTKKSHPVSLR